LTGQTNGSLAALNLGSQDVFLSKYDAAGVHQWTRQLGTSGFDVSNGVSADGLGNVYISGYVDGSLAGPSAGGDDVFVAKYDALGNLLWTRQFGTARSDHSNGVTTDTLGNVFISGTTNGSLVPSDVHPNDFDSFVGKYRATGDLVWLRQFGTTEFDVGAAPSADGLGNVFLSGVTPASPDTPGAGSQDVFVRKYDSDGNVLWKRQFGSSAEDTAGHLSADGSDNVYLVGSTRGSLGGPNAGSQDAFVARYFVPEPSSLVLVLLAVVGLTGLRCSR
jgi:hypothetical protein